MKSVMSTQSVVITPKLNHKGEKTLNKLGLLANTELYYIVSALSISGNF